MAYAYDFFSKGFRLPRMGKVFNFHNRNYVLYLDLISLKVIDIEDIVNHGFSKPLLKIRNINLRGGFTLTEIKNGVYKIRINK